MITIEKIIKEHYKFYKKYKVFPSKLYLTKESYEDLVFILDYKPTKIHGMTIHISKTDGIN